jgi:8-oxo-dGTP pyrophosphatase MutT (NUDIX family)
VRETYEETGIRFQALPLKISTRATKPSYPTTAEDNNGIIQPEFQAEGDEYSSSNPDIILSTTTITTVPNTEPLALCSYPCLYTGTFKLVFWFAAQADSRTRPHEGTRETWEEDMKLEWVDAGSAAGMMTFRMDEEVVEKALEDMRRSGYDI